MPHRCPKCKGYDIDVCPTLDKDYQCCECGHKMNERKPRRAKR